MKALTKLNTYLLRYKLPLIMGIFCVISSNFLAVLIPYFVRIITDLGINNRTLEKVIGNLPLSETIKSNNFKLILSLVFILIAFALVKGVFMFFMRQGIIKISRKIEYDLKNDIFKHYLELSPTFYLKNYTGDLMNRISEDVSRVREYLGPAIMYTVNLCFTFTFVFYMMFSVNARLTLLVLIPIPILVLLIYKVSKYIHEKSNKIEQVLSKITVSAQESFSGIRVIKGYAKEFSFANRFNDLGKEYFDENMDLVKIQSLFMPLMIGLIGTSNIIVIYFGAQGVINGTFTYGNIAEFIIYVNMLTWPVASLGWVTALVQRAAASQNRINQFLDTKSELIVGNHQLPNFNDKIELKNVSFSYGTKKEMMLKHINLAIGKEEKIAIIGKTGSGKSTLLNLIARLYDPTEGNILVDNIDYKQLQIHELRNIITFVPQETFLFSDTIKHNVDLHQTNISNPNLVENVLKQAAVLANFTEFKNGLETQIGERGVTLSGGQKQRLAIARGLYKQGSVLIFDDVFSALDLQTEQLIVQSLLAQKGKTIIISTHRMAIIDYMDKILLLNNGELTAFDTPENINLNFAEELHEILNTQEVDLA